MNASEIIVRPIITEKSNDLEVFDQYVFEVNPAANKIEIRKAVEMAFGVRVEDVRTMVCRAEKRRVGRFRGMTRKRKKAIVRLRAGDSIDFFGEQ